MSHPNRNATQTATPVPRATATPGRRTLTSTPRAPTVTPRAPTVTPRAPVVQNTYKDYPGLYKAFLAAYPYLMGGLGTAAGGIAGSLAWPGVGTVMGALGAGSAAYGIGNVFQNQEQERLDNMNYGGPPVINTNSQFDNERNQAAWEAGIPDRYGPENLDALRNFLPTNPRPGFDNTQLPDPKVTITPSPGWELDPATGGYVKKAPIGAEVADPATAGQQPMTQQQMMDLLLANQPAYDPNPLGSAGNPYHYQYPEGFDPNAPNTSGGDMSSDFEKLAMLMEIGKFAPRPAPVDNTQRDQLFALLQQSQAKIESLTADFQGLLMKMLTQQQSGNQIPVAAAPLPAGATGNSFPLSNIPAVSNMGSNLQFSNAGLGYLNDINPALNRILQQLLAAKSYTDTGQAGQYGPLNYARAGGYGSLAFNDADYENPLNYAGVEPADRESSEAALRMMLSKMGLNA